MNLNTLNSTVKLAVEKLKNDEIMILPSDTLYGLGARAYSKNAVEKVFEIKNRETTKQLPIHYANLIQMQKDIVFNSRFEKLAEKFWPGQLTIVVEKKIDSILTNCDKTIAVRIPDNQILLAILNLLGEPVVMPSANKSGIIPKTTFFEISSELNLGGIQDDEHVMNIQSTIISIVNDELKLLRSGKIDFEEIQIVWNLSEIY